MDHHVKHWMQGEYIQNFGDFLSQYFLQHLFFVQPDHSHNLRIVGSCIDDMFVSPRPDDTQADERTAFWGCGLRTEDGLSADRLNRIEILSVRGPLTRSALRLGNNIPLGDPGLLLPALHKAAVLGRPTGAAVLIPHFHDDRPDAELLALTGCDEVLRPNIPNELTAIEEFVERVVAADFVLCAAMHGAIVAAAYSRPFAFWDSGNIDLPFKWRDFAASLHIPCVFQTGLADARAHYAAEIAPLLQLPIMWPMLVAAPLPVRPDAFISVIELDIRRHGPAALDIKVSSRGANALQARLRLQADAARQASRLREEVAERQDNERSLLVRIDDLSAIERQMSADLERQRAREMAAHEAAKEAGKQRLAEQALREAAIREAAMREAALRNSVAESEQTVGRLRAELDGVRTEAEAQKSRVDDAEALREQLRISEEKLARLRRRAVPPTALHGAEAATEIVRLRAREAWLAAEEARLHEAVQDRNLALAHTQAALQAERAHSTTLQRSLVLRVSAPVRALRRLRLRRTRKIVRLAWLAATFRLGGHLRRRRRLHDEIALLLASPLFDSAWYRQTYPEATDDLAAARHYVFVGARLGHAPNPMFDGDWYGRAYPAASAANWTTPLAHYIAEGANAGLDPHPLFEAAWYGAQNASATSGVGLLTHYLQTGAASGAAPNHLFDVAGYLSEYKDVRSAGLDPVQHYIAQGAGLGYDPHPLFDTDWYLDNHPGARTSGMNPLGYFLRYGMAAGETCSKLFSQVNGLCPDTHLQLPHWAQPEVSIVIPAYGHYFQTVRCLHAVALHSTDVSFETILIDDNPDNPIGPLLQDTAGLRVIANIKNLGFLLSCNQAGALAQGWHIIFLNNDTVVLPGWLEPLLRPVRNDPFVGIVGCKLLNSDGTLQEAGGIVFDDGWGYSFGQGDDPHKPEYNYSRNVDVVTGAAFLVQRDLFRKLGGFDARYAPAFYEEFDLAFEARQAGYRVVYQPDSTVIHLGSTSYGAEARDRQSVRNHAQFCLKWEDALYAQPARETDLFLARQRPGGSGIILMIDDKLPEYDRHAGALTMFQYIGLLRKMGFRLAFAPADGRAPEPYAARLRETGVELVCLPTRLDTWLEAHGRHLHTIWTARPDVTAPLLSLLRDHSPADIVYYPHDLHFVRERRRYDLDGDLHALAESHRLRRLELNIFAHVDCVMTPSQEEARIIADCVPGARIQVIPPYLYPAGTQSAHTARSFANRKDVLFVGGFKHPPNVDAALWLAHEIMPLLWRNQPDARLVIVGDDPTDAIRALARDRVEVTGFVPDLAPYFARARLCAAPLRYGAGVKGKIVSALQAGVPVVTTAIGNEGIALSDGSEVLLGETAAALAAAMHRLFEDASLCESLSEAGSAVVDERFSERRARHAVLDVLGMEQCPLCGNTGLRSNQLVLQTADWAERIACQACHASNRTQALAEVLLGPVRRPDVSSLREARPFLDHLRIHAFGADGPLVGIMQECSLFTCSEFGESVAGRRTDADAFTQQSPQRLSFRDNELDLAIVENGFTRIDDAHLFLREIYRTVRTGGRCLLGRDADGDMAKLVTQAGFAVKTHPVEQADARCGGFSLLEAAKTFAAAG